MAGNHNIENWKPIKGFEGCYEVSDLGAVKSIERTHKLSNPNYKIDTYRTRKSQLLKPNLTANGYPKVCLSRDAKKITRTVHQLVAEAFLNHTVNGHTLIVDHIDNVKTNNSVDNLQLISCRENLSKDRKGKTSKYTGVSYRKMRGTWQSEIRIGGENIYLGSFKTEVEAYSAYKNKLNEIKI